VTTTLSTLNASESAESANSDLLVNSVVICAAIAVLLAVALFLVECSRHPSLLPDAAISLAGP
jgi:hypothetical protein